MKATLFLLGVAALLAGCASPAPEVTTYYDQMTGQRTDLMQNELEAPGQLREVVALNAYRVQERGGPQLYLQANYMAMKDRGYLEIPPGKTLTIIADGKPLVFGGTGSQNMRDTYKRDFVTESALYPVTKAELQRIASSREVKVQIKGNNGLIEREFKAENFARFRKFVTHYAL